MIVVYIALGVAALLAVAIAGAAYYITRRVKGDFFDAGGVRLHYTVEGAGPPVVLLHGFAVNADLNWRLPGITPALARDYQVICLDMRGHGLSGKPHEAERYGIEMCRDVVRLLDHLKIERAQLVGYSLGGFVALKLAVLHPERFISASPLGAGWESARDSAFLASMDSMAAALESGASVPPLSANLEGEREKPGLLHTLWVRIMTRYLNDGHALAAMIRAIPSITVEQSELESIRVPVCSIVGSRDPLERGVQSMKGLVPDHTVVIIDGADHLSATRSPELLAALREFLEKQERASA